MTFTLTRRARGLLLFLSAASYTAWFSGLGDRTDAAGFDAGYPASLSTPHFDTAPPVAAVIARDPFAGAPSHDGGSKPAGPASTLADDSAVPQRIAGSAPSVVVPNIGDIANASVPLPLVVRATIVGSNPVAYVENGTAMDIVRVGDTLGELRVVKIDLSGLTFADGSRLELPGAAAVSAPPTPQPVSVAERLDQIRVLLTKLDARSERNTAPRATAAPAPSETPGFPSPAPLATVDARGIPVGVNPTSDPSAPTPYPDPYPYAPAVHR
jgi:hypothetical protein